MTQNGTYSAEDNTKGLLYVVAVPIGNLGDITFRAAKTLREADLVACEDTRRSRILLDHLGISTRLLSTHKFNEAKRVREIVRALEQGETVALITDAGTPAISDPGHRIVAAASEVGIKVVPIPGACSVTAALSVAGFDCSAFSYLGYVPRKSGAVRVFFSNLKSETRTSVFFDTPVRVANNLRVAAEILGRRKAALFRELTKMYEEILRGDIAGLAEIMASRQSIKGEIVLVAAGAEKEELPEIDVEQTIAELISEGLTGKALAVQAEARFGISKKTAYDTFLRLKD